MALPNDFESTLKEVSAKGILDEPLERIDTRLTLAASGVAAVAAPKDMGAFDWAADALNRIKSALYRELCDPAKKELKAAYRDLLDKALTADGVSNVAAVVGKVVAAINPSFFVSSIVIYLSLWLLKVGLNEWCRVSYD